MTQKNLGRAYADLRTGSRNGNVLRAIECFEAALRVYNESDLREWAITQIHLAHAYCRLLNGNGGDNLRRAIECTKEAARAFAAAGMETAAEAARAAAEALGRRK
jgi:hypothetical protein